MIYSWTTPPESENSERQASPKLDLDAYIEKERKSKPQKYFRPSDARLAVEEEEHKSEQVSTNQIELNISTSQAQQQPKKKEKRSKKNPLQVQRSPTISQGPPTHTESRGGGGGAAPPDKLRIQSGQNMVNLSDLQKWSALREKARAIQDQHSEFMLPSERLEQALGGLISLQQSNTMQVSKVGQGVLGKSSVEEPKIRQRQTEAKPLNVPHKDLSVVSEIDDRMRATHSVVHKLSGGMMQESQPKFQPEEQKPSSSSSSTALELKECGHIVEREDLRAAMLKIAPQLDEVSEFSDQFKLLKCPKELCFQILPQKQQDISALFTIEQIANAKKNHPPGFKNECMLCLKQPGKYRVHAGHQFCIECFNGLTQEGQKICPVPNCKFQRHFQKVNKDRRKKHSCRCSIF